MRIRHVHLLNAPGLPHGIDARVADAGLVLVYGPNASGKSTLGRAVLAALGLRAPDPDVDAIVRFASSTGDEHAVRLLGGNAHGALPAPDGSDSDAWTLHLRDLLISDDEAFARRMRDELYGGYDLDAIAAVYTSGPKQPRKLLGVLEAARRRENEIVALHKALADREHKRRDLEDQIAKARNASAGHARVQAALDLLDVREAADEARRQRDALPRLFERVTADLPDRIEAAESERTTVENEVAAQSRIRDRLRAQLAPLATRLGRADATTLRRLHFHVNELAERERDLAAHARALAAETQAHHARTTRLGPAASGPAIDDAAVAELVEATRELEHADAAARQTQAELDALGPLPDGGDPEPFRAAAQTLETWLGAHGAQHAAASNAAGRRYAAWGAALLVALLAWAGDLAVLGVVAVAITVAFGVWETRSHRGGAGTHAPPVPPWNHPGISAPSEWTIPAVSAFLVLVRTDEAGERAANDSRMRHQAERDATARRVAQHQDARGRAQLRRRQLCERYGFSAAWPWDAAIERAELRKELARSEVRLAEVSAAEKEAQRACQAAADRLAAELRSTEHGASWRGDLAGARAAVAAVESDLDAATKLRAELEAVDAALATLEARRAALHVQRNEWLALLDVESMHEARALLRQLPAWNAACQALRDAERDVHAARQRVGDDELASMDREGLIAREAEYRAQRNALDDLQQQLADLNAELRNAQEGHALADAMEQVRAAEAELADHRDARVASAAAHAVTEWVRGTLERDAVPKALRSAQRWFGRFTREAWELRVHDDGSLRAAPAGTSMELPLSALSDATRVHALLATRLARIEAMERGAPMPLVLDEALSTTDPERLEAVADALWELVTAGRQIFYATSSDADVAWWFAHANRRGHAAPAVLATTGSPARTWADTTFEVPTLARAVPRPQPKEAAPDWFARAGVGRPSRNVDAAQWPAALLFHDRLDAAAACRESGIDTVGQLLHRLRTDPEALPWAKGLRALIASRAHALVEVVREARGGRGRTVTWDEVMASGAISPTFEDRVHALWAEHRDAPADLVRSVRALPRFRSASADDLEQHLVDIDALDDRPPLSAAEIVERATDAAVAAHPDVPAREIEAFATWVVGLVTPHDRPGSKRGER